MRDAIMSSAFLSKEDRRAYLGAMQKDAKRGTRTRFPELNYERHGKVWRFLDSTTGAAVGPTYASKAELLADLERYAYDGGWRK